MWPPIINTRMPSKTNSAMRTTAKKEAKHTEKKLNKGNYKTDEGMMP